MAFKTCDSRASIATAMCYERRNSATTVPLLGTYFKIAPLVSSGGAFLILMIYVLLDIRGEFCDCNVSSPKTLCHDCSIVIPIPLINWSY